METKVIFSIKNVMKLLEHNIQPMRVEKSDKYKEQIVFRYERNSKLDEILAQLNIY